MTRTVTFIVVSLLLGKEAVCQQRYLGRIDGESVSVVLALEQLRDATAWNSEDNIEPPLSIGNAIKAAKAAVQNEYSSLKDKNWKISVSLVEETRSINTEGYFTDEKGVEYYRNDGEETILFNSWVYWVRLTWQPVVGNGLTARYAPNIPVAVLMDGTAVLPSKIAKPIPEPEFNLQYRKLRTP